jgi:hypothetical protein
MSLAQTDSMFVEKTDGSIRGYPISVISQIAFSGTPLGVHEYELLENVFGSFTLYQNYPNPFNPRTNVQYSLPRPGDVEVNIFDIGGRLVRSLLRSHQQAGTQSIVWDSRNDVGGVVASGTYFYQVLFDGSSLVKKLVLIK